MRHYDHHHATVAETRACEMQRRSGTTAPAPARQAAPQASTGSGSIVLDRLRRQAGQPAPSVCRTNTTATRPAVAAASLRDGAAYAARPAHPNRIKFAKDLIRKRYTADLTKRAADVVLLVIDDKPVTASEIAFTIDELLAAPRLDAEQAANRADTLDRYAAMRGTPQAEPTPQPERTDRGALWAEWRALAAALVETSSHPSGARFAIENRAGANDLSFWWVSAHKGSRGPFFKLRQVIGGGRREEVRDPQRMIDIAKRINEAGALEAMLRFGRELGTCGHCGRDLTNEESRAAGIGPVCRTK